jgi:hypothetical protein
MTTSTGSQRIAATLLLIVIVLGCRQLVPIVSPPDPQRVQELVDQQREAQRRDTQPSNVTDGSPRPQGVVIKAHPEWDLDEAAADALGRIGAPAVPKLIDALRKNNGPDERVRAARVLARIGPEAVDAVPMLTTALSDEDPHVQKAAARALGQIGPAAAEAVPALMELLNTEPVEPASP